MRVVCLRCRWCKRTATEKAFTRPEWWVDAGVDGGHNHSRRRGRGQAAEAAAEAELDALEEEEAMPAV